MKVHNATYDLIPYMPSFVVDTENSLQGNNSLYWGVDVGPSHFIARKADIFEADGKPKEISPQEVFRFLHYDEGLKKSAVVSEADEGLVRMVVDAIRQQV